MNESEVPIANEKPSRLWRVFFFVLLAVGLVPKFSGGFNLIFASIGVGVLPTIFLGWVYGWLVYRFARFAICDRMVRWVNQGNAKYKWVRRLLVVFVTIFLLYPVVLVLTVFLVDIFGGNPNWPN